MLSVLSLANEDDACYSERDLADRVPDPPNAPRSPQQKPNGEAPRRSHGVDVDEVGNDLLQSGRMYLLVREHDAVHEQTLDITFLEPGAEACAFTVVG